MSGPVVRPAAPADVDSLVRLRVASPRDACGFDRSHDLDRRRAGPHGERVPVTLCGMNNSESVSAPLSTFSLAVATRSAVERLAPQELEFLDDALSAWERQDLPRRRDRSAAAGTVGLGVDIALVTETVLAVLTGAATEVLGTVATDAWQRRPRWRRRTRGGGVPAAHQRLALTAGQADRLREACRRHGQTLGLSAEQADLLADAVHGAIEGPAHR
ncbi:hypothetical protein [Nucisporomicrobium flavum]|uniref:hypothetical protein n=1 Tax=Nucisporomicrobium flavum TaxID=2785915 RepID=UPI0018F6D20C|nr:hypothetical protein [Nucisporomicrobium flavum]